MTLKKVGLVCGVGFFVVIVLFADFGENPKVSQMAAIAILMAIFWIAEAVSLAATSLLPLILLPLFGIASSKSVAMQYMNSTVFLLIGGFMIALAMQRWNLHKRIAINVLSLFGGHPASLVLGFMLASAGLSMWISNTATTLMLLPIALAILTRFEQILDVKQARQFAITLLLAIAYSASIGGMMTLVGTAPNLVFSRFYEMATGDSIGFAQWMVIAVPTGVTLLTALTLIFCFVYLRGVPAVSGLKRIVEEEKAQLGKITLEELFVLLVFLATAILWITRKGMNINAWSFSGWSDHLPFGKMIDDGSVAITMATLMFFIPGRGADGRKTTLLDESVFVQLPWSVVLLFGGGFALAYGFSESGLSAYLALQLQGLKDVGLPVLILSVSTGMNLITELTSNTATTQLVMPILQSVAKVVAVEPVWLMLPATLSASCAFMFPVATPPNAIIFGSGKVKVIDMIRLGVILNIIAVIIISVFSYHLVPLVF